MGAKENKKISEDFLNLNPETERMFRINAGLAWVGKILKIPAGKKITVTKNMKIILNARPFWGAPEGYPDTSGWRTIEITPEMAGQKIAVFVGREYKVTGSLSPKQKRFGDLLKKMGGIFEVVKPKP